MLYLSYGSNMNSEQMRQRCADAKPIRNYKLPNYQLFFRGETYRAVATIEKGFQNLYVPCQIWDISEQDEKILDIYEGFPKLYNKINIVIKINNENKSVMLYVINPIKPYNIPNTTYFDTIKEGYINSGFKNEVSYLTKSVGLSNLFRLHEEINGIKY